MTHVAVRAVTAEDRPEWERLFRAYRDFYELPEAQHDEVVARVWSWIEDPSRVVGGLVAELGEGEERRIVGLAHWRPFDRPSTGTVGIWLDDLYVDPEVRGHGVGRLLIQAVQRIADDNGCSVVRWITAESNQAARRLYDDLASQTHWVTYDATPAA